MLSSDEALSMQQMFKTQKAMTNLMMTEDLIGKVVGKATQTVEHWPNSSNKPLNARESVVQKIRILLLSLFVLLLSGCKVQLYTGLTEKEGNDMLAILLDNSIPAEKVMDKDGNVTLTVSTDDVSRAIRLLRTNGHPKDKFSSVSDIFPKDSLISSPTEEKARYTYSMSQELSATISMIDGVLTARVHVVLPQDSGASEANFPSSASVFIKYTPELELAGFVPKVKTLVRTVLRAYLSIKLRFLCFLRHKSRLTGFFYPKNWKQFSP